MALWLTRDVPLEDEDEETNYCLWSIKPNLVEGEFVDKPGRNALLKVFCKREWEKHISVKLKCGDIHLVESIVVKLRREGH